MKTQQACEISERASSRVGGDAQFRCALCDLAREGASGLAAG